MKKYVWLLALVILGACNQLPQDAPLGSAPVVGPTATTYVAEDLGTLGGSVSYALDVSADGSTVVGWSYNALGNQRAFRYKNGVMTDLGTLGGSLSVAQGVSADGLTVVGYSYTTGNSQYHAFSHKNGVMTDLGTLGGGSNSVALDVSADGSTVVGNSYTTDNSQIHASSYKNGVMTDLGTLGGTYSEASGVSADGSTVVGQSLTSGNSQLHAFIHKNGVMTDLGTLGGSRGVAHDVSADGSAVVGYSDTTGGQTRATRWAVAKTAQTLTFDPLSGKTYADAPFTVSASSTSDLAVTISSDTAAVCTVSPSDDPATPATEHTVTLLTAGTCTLTAAQAGNATYAAATPVSQGFAVAKAAPVVSFTGTPTTGERGGTVEVAATSSSDAPLILSAAPETVCTLADSTLSLLAVGDCTVTASQVETANYLAGSAAHVVAVVRTLTPTTVSAVAGSGVYGGTAGLSATLTSGGAPVAGKDVSFVVPGIDGSVGTVTDSNGVVTLSGVSLTGLNAGTYNVTASFYGDDTDGLEASSATGTLTVAKAEQTLTFSSTAPSDARVGQTYEVAASASSLFPVSFSATGACTVLGSTVSFTAVGTCTVAADQAGDDNHNAAPQTTQEVTVIAATDGARLDNVTGSGTYGSPAVLSATLTSTSGSAPLSGKTVSFTVDGNDAGSAVTNETGVASVSVNGLNAGDYGVGVSFAGDGAFDPTSGDGAFSVAQASQTLSFSTTPPNPATVGGSYTALASATSSLPVALASDPAGVCTLAGNTVSFVGAGTCTLTATQGGDANYAAAAGVAQSFTVQTAPPAAFDYTANFDNLTVGRVVWNVSLGRGVSSSGRNTNRTDVYGERSGRSGNTAVVTSARQLVIARNSTSQTPYDRGGRLYVSFGRFPGGVGTKTVKVGATTTTGGHVAVYRNRTLLKRVAIPKTRGLVTLDIGASGATLVVVTLTGPGVMDDLVFIAP